jgi:hypothetical protein
MLRSQRARVDSARGSLSQLLAQAEHRVSSRAETVLNTASPSLDQWRVLVLLSDGRPTR